MKPLIPAALFLAAAAQAPAIDPTLAPYADASGAVRIDGNRRINLFCTGAKPRPSAPTVILTGGAGAAAPSWRKVQPELARQTRVCAWDRAGFGLSDASPAAQTATETAADLARALTAAGIAEPYVVVGHSIGAYETLRFTDTHRRAVVGMVLVDPSIPDQFARFRAVAPTIEDADEADLAGQVAQLRRCADRLRTAPLPADDPCVRGNPAAPLALAAAIAERQRDPARFRTAASFFESMPLSAKAIVDPRRRYGAKPLIVLTAGVPDPLPAEATAVARAEQAAGQPMWVAAHDDYAALSRRGVNRTVDRTGHMMQQQRPDAIVAAVAEVLAQVRQK